MKIRLTNTCRSSSFVLGIVFAVLSLLGRPGPAFADYPCGSDPHDVGMIEFVACGEAFPEYGCYWGPAGSTICLNLCHLKCFDFGQQCGAGWSVFECLNGCDSSFEYYCMS